jgi:hypothetical protein
MSYVPIDAVAGDRAGLWNMLCSLQESSKEFPEGRGAILTPAQIRELLADNARLVEAKNVLVREHWELKKALLDKRPAGK